MITSPARPFRRSVLVLAMVMVLALLTGLLSGCAILGVDTSGSSGDTSGGTVTPLPMPSIRRVDPPELTADQQARQDEVNQYLAKQYQAKGWRIVDTTQTYIGDIVDWLDPASVAGSDKDPPPPPPQPAPPEGAQIQLTEMDVHPELRGPDGTIPIWRPTFMPYVAGDTGATSLDDFISNYQAVGSPSAQSRLYAGILTSADNQGADVSINAYGGEIEPNTLSVLEMVVGCRMNGEMWQQIGIAAVRDNVNRDRKLGQVAGSVLRLGVEFLSAGPYKTGKGYSGWDSVVNTGDFVAARFRPYGPGAPFEPSTISTVGGTQYESRYYIELWNGDWWVAHNGHWLGYYPAELFDSAPPPNMIASKACEVVTVHGPDRVREIQGFCDAVRRTRSAMRRRDPYDSRGFAQIKKSDP